MHVCTHMYVVCVYVLVYVRESSWVGLRVAAFQTRSDDSNSVTGDSDLYPFWTQYNGDLKTGP